MRNYHPRIGFNKFDPKEKKMVTQEKDKVLVVIQLTGGNDFMNTVIP